MTTLTTTGTHFELRKVTSNIGAEVQGIDLSEELDGDTVAALRLAGLAAGGDPAGDAALDGAFAATAFMLDYF